MGIIPYQGGITRYITLKVAKKNKEAFKNLVETDFNQVLRHLPTMNAVNLELVSYSSKHDFLEQLLSIVSFLRYAGKPKKWIIYSDGSHEQEHDVLLEKHLPFVEIIKHDFKATAYPLKPALEAYRSEVLAYANSKFPLGKKLLYYLNHEVNGSTVFLDSDILFYEKAIEINQLEEKEGWFLPEWIWGTLDESYKKQLADETMYQVNSGFFKISGELNATKGLAYLKSLGSNYEYFTEQTTIHIIFNENNLWPLDPRTYFLNNSDMFEFGYNFNKSDIAIRHYTSPVRHKMWQRNWKWQLSIHK